MSHPQKKYMSLAIKQAKENLTKLQGGPFGACIVKKNQIIALSKNTVLRNDATCHAEINAIRSASKKLKTYDLSGCVIYSTTEPCPMCFSAIHWARIDMIIYGTSIRDAQKLGFNELNISNSAIKRIGKSPVKIISHFLNKECLKLFDAWQEHYGKVIY